MGTRTHCDCGFTVDQLREKGDEGVNDTNVAEALAGKFISLYRLDEPHEWLQEAKNAIDDTLTHGIPGCLTGNQAADEDVQALIFAATAAKHGWTKR